MLVIESIPTILYSYLFGSTFGQNILWIIRRHLLWKMFSLSSSVLLIFQYSDQYKSTDILLLYILICVLLMYWFNPHIFRRSNVALAIRILISAVGSSWVYITEPRYVKLSGISISSFWIYTGCVMIDLTAMILVVLVFLASPVPSAMLSISLVFLWRL